MDQVPEQAGRLSGVSVSVSPTDVSYYFAEYPLQGSNIDTSQETIRGDLPSGSIKSGSSYHFNGPATPHGAGNILCLVTKDAGGRVVGTVCNSNTQSRVYSCNFSGINPQPAPQQSSGSYTWPWWTWLIFIILVLIIILLGAAYYRKKV